MLPKTSPAPGRATNFPPASDRLASRSRNLTRGLAALRGHEALGSLRRGVEKESLRVFPSGALATTPHPRMLGSPLTHPHITTDFSEAQLELITGVHDNAAAALAELEDVHRFVCANIGEELLWSASMPCRLGAEAEIPVARFGTSNAGRCKTIYRLGLAHRYGRVMQTISGIHYNFSVPESLWPAIAQSRGETAGRDFVTNAYFDLIRNFRRYSWLLLYLFGASPAVCRSFVSEESAEGLETLDADTLFLPNATCLRMGPLGYQSEAQSSLHISYNGLPEYAASMRAALTEPYPPYAAIGTKADGEYRQLSTALLQIENEFYGTIRPKRRARSGERPLDALHDRGVEYVEVRCLDLDPFLPLGMDASTCRFLDVFLLMCLLLDSPPDSVQETESLLANQRASAEDGRSPGLALARDESSAVLVNWGRQLLTDCQRVADAVDETTGGRHHAAAVEQQRRKLEDPALTPSARVLAALREAGISFGEFGLRRSAAHKRWLAERPLDAANLERFNAMAAASLRDQASVEAADAASAEGFDAYLQRYLQLRR